MKSTIFSLIEKDVSAFPSMPGAAAKLLKLLRNPDSSTAEVENILRCEPGLTANILKMTNSAYFGLTNRVGSIRQAMVLLGWKRLYQLVIASCVSAMMDKPVPGYDLPAGELWRHSIAVSAAAEGLAKELQLSGTDEIFTAGLLHDVGKMILGKFVEQDLVKIDFETYHNLSFEKVEQDILGTDHAEVGARILEKWRLPAEMIAAVRWHHEPENAPSISQMGDVVHVADFISLMIGVGVGREGLQYEPSKAVTRRLGIHIGHIEKIASQTLEWVSDLTASFK